MTDHTFNPQLPADPDLQWLRKEAKRQLRALQATNPDARLADAQFSLARDYGFSSWRALKSHVDGLTVAPLIASILDQAEQSPAAEKAAALLSVSRVVSARDRMEGVRVLERGIAVAQALRDPTRLVLLSEAFTIAAMLSPDHAFGLLADLEEPSFIHVRAALYRMIEHGHHDAAIRYLLSAPDESGFPFDAVDHALRVTEDNQTRVALLRKAVRAVRCALAAAAMELPHALSEFLMLFNGQWRSLPAEEASAVVRELVAAIVSAPHDSRGTFTYQDARFSSARQHCLFLLLGPCRDVEPELAERLIGDYSQLARAIERLPNGLDSLCHRIPDQPSIPSRPPQPQPEPDLSELAESDYVSLDDAFVPVGDELRTGFARSFKVALNSYAVDTDRRRPNTAPRHCWPSAYNFRSILHKAGQYEGRAAVAHLDRVPDPALRLFAQIELTAALAGLPQLGGTILNQAPEHPPRRRRQDPGGDFTPGPPVPAPFLGKPDVPPSYEVRIAPSRAGRGVLPTGGCDADYWVISGAPLRPVLAELFEISPVRIVLPTALESARYDFTLVLPRDESREVLFATMRAGVERHFHARRQRRTADVQIVTAPRGVSAYERLEELGEEWPSVGGGSFEFAQMSSESAPPDFEDLVIAFLMDLSSIPTAAHQVEDELRRAHDRFLRTLGAGALRGIQESLTMTRLCLALETSLRRVFVDETGASGTYRINVQVDVSEAAAFLKVLCDELGLEVTPGRREIEMLVVE